MQRLITQFQFISLTGVLAAARIPTAHSLVSAQGFSWSLLFLPLASLNPVLPQDKANPSLQAYTGLLASTPGDLFLNVHLCFLILLGCTLLGYTAYALYLAYCGAENRDLSHVTLTKHLQRTAVSTLVRLLLLFGPALVFATSLELARIALYSSSPDAAVVSSVIGNLVALALWLIVTALGAPAAMLALLVNNNQRLDHPSTRHKYGALYLLYTPSNYLAGIGEYVIRTAVALVAGLFVYGPFSLQLAFLLLLAVVTLAALLRREPYLDIRLYRAHLLGTACHILSLGLMYAYLADLDAAGLDSLGVVVLLFLLLPPIGSAFLHLWIVREHFHPGDEASKRDNQRDITDGTVAISPTPPATLASVVSTSSNSHSNSPANGNPVATLADGDSASFSPLTVSLTPVWDGQGGFESGMNSEPRKPTQRRTRPTLNISTHAANDNKANSGNDPEQGFDAVPPLTARRHTSTNSQHHAQAQRMRGDSPGYNDDDDDDDAYGEPSSTLPTLTQIPHKITKSSSSPNLTQSPELVANNMTSSTPMRSSKRLGKGGLRLDLSVISKSTDADMGDEDAKRKQKLAQFDNVASRITDFLFVGGAKVAANKHILQANGITHIVNCAAQICENPHTSEFAYKTLCLNDNANQDISYLILEVIEYIESVRNDTESGAVLVHCQQGVSRSCSMVIAYLMWHYDWDYERAHEYVKERRSICNPNLGFVLQLMSWHRRRTNRDTDELTLYRVAPQTTFMSDSFLTLKLVRSHTLDALDPRGVFVLHAGSELFVWVGSEHSSEHADVVDDHIARLRRFDVAIDNVTRVHQDDVASQDLQRFYSLLGNKGDIEHNRKYDADFQYASVHRSLHLQLPGKIANETNKKEAPQGTRSQRKAARARPTLSSTWSGNGSTTARHKRSGVSHKEMVTGLDSPMTRNSSGLAIPSFEDAIVERIEEDDDDEEEDNDDEEDAEGEGRDGFGHTRRGRHTPEKGHFMHWGDDEDEEEDEDEEDHVIPLLFWTRNWHRSSWEGVGVFDRSDLKDDRIVLLFPHGSKSTRVWLWAGDTVAHSVDDAFDVFHKFSRHGYLGELNTNKVQVMRVGESPNDESDFWEQFGES